MPLPELRPFQYKAIKLLEDSCKSGHKRHVIMCPTGGGKTMIAMSIIERCFNKGNRVVFMADRKTLVNQSSGVADSIGLLDHSILMAQHWRMDVSKRIQIASIQTLARRGWPDADIYIIDECHTLMHAWTDHIKNCDKIVIGLSATPFSNLGQYFTNLITAATMKELTDDGYLVPMRIYSCTKVDMRGAETQNGEWTSRAAAERGTKIIGDVVSDWIKFGENRKTIVFGANIAHCERMCKEFNENGIMAHVFTAYTSDADRESYLKEFEKEDSQIKILLTVEALAKGFDNKLVSCICDVRPLRKSFSTAVQMWGRMLRCAPSKKDALLLDFSGNIIRFGADFEELYHNGLTNLYSGDDLDKKVRKERAEKEEKKCPSCEYKPFHGHCMSCGHEVKRRSLIEHEEGEMHEVNIRGLKTTKQDLWDQCVSLCSLNGDKSNVAKRAAHLYKSMVGEYPSTMDAIVRNIVISKEVIGQYKHNLIKWHKSRKRMAV